MLRYRLLFGILMTIAFAGLVVFDGWLDGSLTVSTSDDKAAQGTIFCVLIALVMIPAQQELAKLAAQRELRFSVFFSTIASILISSTWYWRQFVPIQPEQHFFMPIAIGFGGLLLLQYLRYGTQNVLANCGAGCFCIIYLGILSSFILAIRIDYGTWPLLMFVFTIKCSDIGAYTAGKLFGKHKFSPKISPGKTWEGMAGAIVAAAVVALAFCRIFDIMGSLAAVLFGICFAFIGQLGDLIESMIKRDAQQKDSSRSVPGFGGVLDVIDSPLLAAPIAYLFFAAFAG